MVLWFWLFGAAVILLILLGLFLMVTIVRLGFAYLFVLWFGMRVVLLFYVAFLDRCCCLCGWLVVWIVLISLLCWFLVPLNGLVCGAVLFCGYGIDFLWLVLFSDLLVLIRVLVVGFGLVVWVVLVSCCGCWFACLLV